MHSKPNSTNPAIRIGVAPVANFAEIAGSHADLPFVATKQELATVLRCSTKHIEHLSRRGLLKPLRLGRCVRYRRDAVIRALDTIGGGA